MRHRNSCTTGLHGRLPEQPGAEEAGLPSASALGHMHCALSSLLSHSPLVLCSA